MPLAGLSVTHTLFAGFLINIKATALKRIKLIKYDEWITQLIFYGIDKTITKVMALVRESTILMGKHMVEGYSVLQTQFIVLKYICRENTHV